MARTAITVTQVSRTPVERPAQQVATTELMIEGNDGRIILEVEAPEATEWVIPVPGKVDGQAVESIKWVPGVGKTQLLGPFPPGIYNQPDNSVLINPNNTKGKVRAYRI